MSTDLGPPTRARDTDPETSHEALADHVKQDSRRHEILSVLSRPAFFEGLCTYEIADILGLRRDSVSSHMKPMERVGLVKRTGKTKVSTQSGNRNELWMIGEAYWNHPIAFMPMPRGFNHLTEWQTKAPPKRYCVGLAFTKGFNYVTLVRKTHPEWQAGRWNGVGGKLEAGESPLEAMRREFAEECSLDVVDWDLFAVLGGLDDTARRWEVSFFWTFIRGDNWSPSRNFGLTEERVEVMPIDWLNRSHPFSTIDNIPFLIEIAKSRARSFRPQPTLYIQEGAVDTPTLAGDIENEHEPGIF